jgi:hypothetical protein
VTAPPPCTGLGRHCHALRVTLRVAHLDDGVASGDAEATWLLGHTERIRFGDLRRQSDHLYARATLHVPCRHLEEGDGSRARCRAHGFRGTLPRPVHRAETRQRGDGQFTYVHRGRVRTGRLDEAPPTRRSLPVVPADNPCATARCRTANHQLGAACCRDLQIEILCRKSNRRLEALVRNRRSPLLCKTERESEDSLSAEVISACSFLEPDGASCALHGRTRPDGRRAKPDLCFDWPGKESNLHPGCVFAPGARRGAAPS